MRFLSRFCSTATAFTDIKFVFFLKLCCNFGSVIGLTGHWNPTVKQLTNSVIKMYSKGDAKLYDSILANHLLLQREKQKQRVKKDTKWGDIVGKNGQK